jgi:hypothetical protein
MAVIVVVVALVLRFWFATGQFIYRRGMTTPNEKGFSKLCTLLAQVGKTHIESPRRQYGFVGDVIL